MNKLPPYDYDQDEESVVVNINLPNVKVEDMSLGFSTRKVRSLHIHGGGRGLIQMFAIIGMARKKLRALEPNYRSFMVCIMSILRHLEVIYCFIDLNVNMLGVVLCHVMLCFVMLCYVMLCYVMLCHVMLCYVLLCYVMLCYVMLCYVML